MHAAEEKTANASFATPPYLSDHEFSAAITKRAFAITQGAPLNLTRAEKGIETHPVRLALLEWKLKKSPCFVIRETANDKAGKEIHKKEYRSINTLRKLSDTTNAQP